MRTIHITIPAIPITVTLEQLRDTCEILGLTLVVDGTPIPPETDRDKQWAELRELWKEQERINKRAKELEEEYFG